jgi:hypothetical protein
MKKIDKTLREVRRWKQRVAAKTKGMTTEEVVSFFHSAPRPPLKKSKAA